MLCGANRNKRNKTDHSRGKHIGKSSVRWLLFFAVLVLMPAAASAAGSKVSSQEELFEALEAGETAIALTADLVTDANIFLLA